MVDDRWNHLRRLLHWRRGDRDSRRDGLGWLRRLAREIGLSQVGKEPAQAKTADDAAQGRQADDQDRSIAGCSLDLLVIHQLSRQPGDGHGDGE